MPTKAQAKDDKQRILEFYEPSIAKLETSIAELETQAKTKPTKTITNKIGTLKAEINRKKRDNKATGQKLELENHGYLYFIESTGGWSKLTGHSALFFHFDVAPRLKNPTHYNLISDTDSYSPSTLGVISIRLTEQFIDELAAINITPVENESYGITIFKLPWTYTSEEIDQAIVKLEQTSERINSLIIRSNIVPELFDALKDLNSTIYHNCRRFTDVFTRDSIGKELYEKSNNAILRYLEVSNNNNSVELGFQSILKNIYFIRYSLTSISELHLMPQKHILRIGTQTVLIERIVKKYLNGIQKNV